MGANTKRFRGRRQRPLCDSRPCDCVDNRQAHRQVVVSLLQMRGWAALHQLLELLHKTRTLREWSDCARCSYALPLEYGLSGKGKMCVRMWLDVRVCICICIVRICMTLYVTR